MEELKFHDGYSFPNQDPRFLRKILIISKKIYPKRILCIGGIFYAHYLKALCNKSYVEAIDMNEVSITGQCIVAMNNIYKFCDSAINIVQLSIPPVEYDASSLEKSRKRRISLMKRRNSQIKLYESMLIRLAEKAEKDGHPWLNVKKIKKYIMKNEWELTRPTNGDPRLVKRLKVKFPDKINCANLLNYKSSKRFDFISTNNVIEQIWLTDGPRAARRAFEKILGLLSSEGIIEICTNSKKINQREFISFISQRNSKKILFCSKNGKYDSKYIGPIFITKTSTQLKDNVPMEVVAIKKH